MISPCTQADMDTICKCLPAVTQEINILPHHSRTFHYSFSSLWPDDSLTHNSELTNYQPMHLYISRSLFSRSLFHYFCALTPKCSMLIGFHSWSGHRERPTPITRKAILKPLALLPSLSTQSCHACRVFYQCQHNCQHTLPEWPSISLVLWPSRTSDLRPQASRQRTRRAGLEWRPLYSNSHIALSVLNHGVWARHF